MRFIAPTRFLAFFCALALTMTAASASPTNVIFLIGDGMGFEQVKAAGIFANGAPGTLSFEQAPYSGEVTTYSANSSVTDSAAAATAIATGVKVNNYVISQTAGGQPIQTVLEYFQDAGKSTGLVTTTYMTHATPAAFAAHEVDRNSYTAIGADYLQTRPDVLLGGGANGMSVSSAQAAGYSVVTNADGLAGVNAATTTMLSGQFGNTYLPYEYDGLGLLPHLSQMAAKALDVLDNDADGFFLMIEGGLIDQAGHARHLGRNVGETVEFANTVQTVLDWAAGRTDTLIIVTADHETGGLHVTGDPSTWQDGVLPAVTWSTTGHTGVNVPVYAWGPNAELVSGTINNTDFFHIATVPEPATMLLLTAGGLAVLRRRG